ncbi:MAG: phosphotransferase [Campylobacterota bacterium]|nr:phosphotransferase [Campylobacterota bacterium]
MQLINYYVARTKWKDWTLELASADASFRRYFRIYKGDESVILMDSSLEKESLKPFIDVTNRLLHVNVKAPQILDINIEDGFLIIEDFGNAHYLNVLDDTNYEKLYSQAMAEIVTMQDASAENLPLYDRDFLRFEMDLMPQWYLKEYLHVNLSAAQEEMINTSLDEIITEVELQPQGLFVHRDYHSRNIMIPREGEVGVIDYQDAMSGAVTYDLVSLLKDCYVEYDAQEVERLALKFRDMKNLHVDDATFIRWFDFMGLQRHIKVLGIFCRLYLRDGKDGYLNDLPLTLKYVIQTANKYEKTRNLAKLLSSIKLPKT